MGAVHARPHQHPAAAASSVPSAPLFTRFPRLSFLRVVQTDEAMYTGIMTSLIPDVFMRISEDLTKEIRKFSKK